MGLTKQYLRFTAGPVFGVVSSALGNILLIDHRNDHLIAVPACENVYLWNYRTSEKVGVLHGDKHAVTSMIWDSGKSIAVGYSDGAIRIFALDSKTCTITFHGHRSPVSCLAYDQQCLRLSSGGKDTEIVLWDLVGETGLFRLKGHKAPVTKCHFLKRHNILISGSEDTLLKFWDLDSQHCFKTVVASHAEISDFVLVNDCRLISGANESDLNVWDVHFKNSKSHSDFRSVLEEEELDSVEDELDLVSVVKFGKILTQGDNRIKSLKSNKEETVFGCHGYTKTLHLFKILTHEESLKKFRRRKRKEMKRNQGDPDVNESISLNDVIQRISPIQADAKIVTFDIKTLKNGHLRIATLLNNNSFSIYDLDIETKASQPSFLCDMKSGGHRSNINTLSFSTDSIMILSASSESIKIWNADSQRCTHTFFCDVALCSAFVAGNSYCVIGTKSGLLQLYELSSHQLIEKINAHDGSVSTLCKSPDQKGIVTGGSDKELKFWDYELIKDEDFSETKKRLTLTHSRTLKLTEEIICARYSPNHKFIAVSLLDCTVKVFFCDTLKFAFSLYGHKLPIPCLDISYDSTILVTGSKDRNVKIWSLEFGNCLKSIFAHEDSITCIQFLPKTHMFFTAGKDKKLKQWDADNFQKISTFEGHQSKIISLAVSPDGLFVVSSSQDKSIRLWEKTNEPLVLEEELEIEREKESDKQLASEEPIIAGETNKEVGLAGKTTLDTLKGVEQLIEALDIYKSEVAKLQDYKIECKQTGKDLPHPVPDPMLAAYSVVCPHEFMLKVLRKTKSSCIEEILLHLPFNYVLEFLNILTEFSVRNWDIELTTRCLLFLLRINLRQISVTKDASSLIDKLKSCLLGELRNIKDIVGFNAAGLKFIQRLIDGTEEISLVDEALVKLNKKKNRKRHMIAFK